MSRDLQHSGSDLKTRRQWLIAVIIIDELIVSAFAFSFFWRRRRSLLNCIRWIFPEDTEDLAEAPPLGLEPGSGEC